MVLVQEVSHPSEQLLELRSVTRLHIVDLQLKFLNLPKRRQKDLITYMSEKNR